MIAVIEMAYLCYWCRTFFSSMEDARQYRQRLATTAAMIVFLLAVGHYASKQLGAVLCGWAVACEVACAIGNFLELDERLFPRKATR
jgi:hypothetical protein